LHTFNALSQLEHKREEDNLGLNDEQVNLMISAIEIKDRKVIELMIPIKNVFMIDYDEILDKFKINLILDKGYSRIPVFSNHDKNDLYGLLRIKSLIGVDFNQNKTLRQLGVELKKPLVISPRLTMIDLLREFRKGKSHMAFITEQVEELQTKLGLNRTNSIQKERSDMKMMNEKEIKILGIITLEDVIEKMINLDILDEDDYEEITKNKKASLNKMSKLCF
jgi:metal transporter CNNM